MSKRKHHSFTVTVTAPAQFTRSEIRREIRTNITDHAAWMNGKHGRDGDWIDLDEKAIKVRSIS
jgi:hypothetical protein